MTVKLFLDTRRNQTVDGFPIILQIVQNENKRYVTVGFSFKHHFIDSEQIISQRHPDYDILMPIIADLKIRAKKVVLKKIKDVNVAHAEIFRTTLTEISFIEFGEKLMTDMVKMSQMMTKNGNKKKADNILGTVKSYKNVLAQFDFFGQKTTLENLSFEILTNFKNYQLGLGNSKSTINLYLRALRSIYNKGILMYRLPDPKPFAGLFAGLKVRAFSNRKRYLDKETIFKLEQIEVPGAKQKYLDLFLLQFYCGGCDLIDLYFLQKKQIRRGRLIFERTKTDTNQRIDIKLHPKALLILQKFTSNDNYIFSFGKEKSNYEVFRRTFQRGLISIQKLHDIEVLPDGDNLSVKVARHTFMNLAKQYRIEPDLIRELVGHERDDVDNYYKDKFPEKDRDLALFQIISSFECKE